MSKYKAQSLKELRDRLKASDPTRWRSLTDEQKSSIVETYYQIRDLDYQNINFLLREHANEKKQFSFLVLGICMGVFANPISSVLLEYFPTENWPGNLLTVLFFGSLLAGLVILFLRMSAESLGEENVIDRLLEVREQMAPNRSE